MKRIPKLRRFILLLFLAGLFTGCMDLSQLRSGRRLMEEGRYPQAYTKLKQAAEELPLPEAETALRECVSLWAATLFAEAQKLLEKGKRREALTSLIKANDLTDPPEITALIRKVDKKYRLLCKGAENLPELCRKRKWLEAGTLAAKLLEADPYDGRFRSAFCKAREQFLKQSCRNVEALLESGRFSDALKEAKRAFVRFRRLRLHPSCLSWKEPALTWEVSQAFLFPGSVPEAWPDCCYNNPPLRELYSGSQPDSTPADRLKLAGLSETARRAVKTRKLISRAHTALTGNHFLKAVHHLRKAEQLAPPLDGILFLLKRLEESIASSWQNAMEAAFLSGDLSRCVKLLALFQPTGIDLRTKADAERKTGRLREQVHSYRDKLRKLMTGRIQEYIKAGFPGNALLLISTGRKLFPELWVKEERTARDGFMRSIPTLKITGGGRKALSSRLEEAGVPMSGGKPVLHIKAGKVRLELIKFNPAYGFEDRRVPAGLASRPHPQREELRKRLELAREKAAAPPPSTETWELEFWKRKVRFWNRTCLHLKEQFERTPKLSYKFKWTKKCTKVVYYRMKATLSQSLTFLDSNKAIDRCANGGSGTRQKRKTLHVQKFYTAKVPPGADPFLRGDLPSEVKLRSDLTDLLSQKAATYLKRLFELQLEKLLIKAGRLAAAGKTGNATEVLCRVYATQPESREAFQEAEKLLSQLWGKRRVASLLNPLVATREPFDPPEPQH